jgi:DNA-binding Lrp family transcriptional regulator
MLDEMDKALIHALRIDGRAPFNRIATVIGTSPQTVARRYQRLRAESALRVVGVVDPRHTGQAQWLIRLVVNPRSALEIAQALARRPDTSWVKLTSGGTEIIAIVTTPVSSSSHSLLLRYIPQTASVVSVSAHCLLHTYLGGPSFWRGGAGILNEEQTRQLMPPDREAAAARPPRQALTDGDRKLLAALQRDGRTSIADLATVSDYSPVTVARRIADLQASGAIFFDVEIDATLLGSPTQALLWMSVAPAHIDAVGTALAKEEELAFVASTTGPTNLVATVLCQDPTDMHHFLARRLGSLGDIRTLETSPVMRTLKGASSAPLADPLAGRDRMNRKGGPQG